MSRQLTEHDARLTLSSHAESKGMEVHEKYGPEITWQKLKQIVADRSVTRYPCEIVFDASQLCSGELAYAAPGGERPEDGFIMYVHPAMMTRLDLVPCIVLYQLVTINYGEFASSDDAEIFASSAMGMGRQEYYEMHCSIVDEFVPCRN